MRTDAAVLRALRYIARCLQVPSVAGLFIGKWNLVAFLVVAGGYYIAARFCIQMGIPDPNVSALWFPAGIGVAAVMLKGKRAVFGIFCGAVLMNLVSRRSMSLSVGVAACCTGEAIVGACLATKLSQGKAAFSCPANYLKFVLFTGVIASVFFGVIGAVILDLAGTVPRDGFWLTWIRWSSGDLLGIILLAPFLVLLFGHKHHSLGVRGTVEIIVLLAGLLAVCVVNFGPSGILPIPSSGIEYFCIPFLFWAGLRFCPLEASGAALLVGSFATWGSLHGFGPFSNPVWHSILRTCFVLIVTITTMTGAVAWAQQQKNLEDTLFLYCALKAKHRNGG